MQTRRITNEIIVHCTATIRGRHYTVQDITRWHIKRGFATIGYHYVIYLDGTIQAGRPERFVGAHCQGHNSRSIGICYVGGLDYDGTPADTRTPQQKLAMLQLIQSLQRSYPGITVHGHREFARKSCPCFDAHAEYNI